MGERAPSWVLLVVILVVAVMPAVAITYDLANTTPTSGTIPIGTQSGTNVFVENTGGEMNLQDRWVDANTVRVTTGPTAGNATITSTGAGTLTLAKTTGAQTKVTGIDANNTEIQINPEDKLAANITGGVKTFDFSDATVDDNSADFTYSAAGNQSEIVIRGVAANTDVRAVAAGTSDNLGGGQSDGSGTVRLTQMQAVSSTGVELQSSNGGPGLSNPEPQGTQTDFPTQISVNVSDPDFASGDNVSVEFYVDGTSQGTVSTESEGRVTLSISKPSRGNHTARAVATDSTGNTNELNWEFAVPESLFINRASDPGVRIDDRQVNVTFFEDDQVFRRSTTNGEVSMEGLPLEGDIIASVSAESTSGTGVKDRSYRDSEIIIEDISVPETVYLLDTNVTSTTTRFTLRDRTSKFEGNGAQLIIQFVDNSTGTPQYQTIYGDEFGVEGVTVNLIKGERYRLLVSNADDDERVLGTYDADVDETVPLTVGSVKADLQPAGTTWRYNATYQNTSSGNFVRFEFNDSQSDTSSVQLEIHERGDRSNKLVDNQTFSGPLGTLSVSEPVPTGEENETWVVRATVNRNGQQQSIRRTVGPRNPILSGLSGWVRAVISIGSIFVVAGLFSRLNSPIGGLVVAGLGGIFWFIDFLPQETGVGVVILSMVVAGIMFVHGRQQ